MADVDPDGESGNRNMALIGLGVTVAIFALGLWIAHALYTAGKTQDCLMSGRTNCEPILPSAPDK